MVAFDAGVVEPRLTCPTLARLLHAGVVVVAVGARDGDLGCPRCSPFSGEGAVAVESDAEVSRVARARNVERSDVLRLSAAVPAELLAALRAVAARCPVDLPAHPVDDPAWQIDEHGFVLAREHEIESLFALGNGYVGVRASLAEGTPLSSPATFVAGVYQRRGTESAVPELLRLPEWASVEGTIDGEPIRLERGEILRHRRVLDLRSGMFWREWRHRDPSGRVTTIRGVRLASQADRHLLLQSVTLTPENYSGRVVVRSTLSGGQVTSTDAGQEVAMHVTSTLETPVALVHALGDDAGEARPAEPLVLDVERGATHRLDRIVSVFSSREAADPREAARRHAERVLCERGLDALVTDHLGAWAELWEAADVRVDGALDDQIALRFAVYHLSSAVHPEDEAVSIGARGLTGTGYAGHVFWDTEIYMLPFFTLTRPRAARSILGYRHKTLDAARARARARGCRGALYAWESADTGEDVTPPFILAPDGEIVPVLAGEQELHISADVAYGVWSYWYASGDDAFLREQGAEILIETARFWASRATLGEDGRYHLLGVMGPDEYHASADDDAFTNVMAQWNLERAAEVVSLARRRWPREADALLERLGVGADEPRGWLDVASRMYVGLDEESGLIEQFRGYFDLEDIDLSAHEPRQAPIDVLLGRERVAASQVIKQPDVVMLFHLLEDRFPRRVREACFRYYEPRTAHGSSLSPPVHAAVAARLGDVELAARYFRQTAEIDLANNMGNAASGVHMAAVGGLWQAAVLGFAGLRLDEDGPRVEPHLSPRWRGMSFRVLWRGRSVPFELEEEGS